MSITLIQISHVQTCLLVLTKLFEMLLFIKSTSSVKPKSITLGCFEFFFINEHISCVLDFDSNFSLFQLNSLPNSLN